MMIKKDVYIFGKVMKEFQWIQGIDDTKVGDYLRKIEEMFQKLYPTDDEEGIKKVHDK